MELYAKKFLKFTTSFFVFFFISFCFISIGFTQTLGEEGVPVEIDGDTVEYSVDGNKVIASGDVIVSQKDTRLYCDYVEFDRNNNVAYAKGDVRLITKTTELAADNLTYNFKTEKGDFHNAKFYSNPYYGAAKKVSKVDDNTLILEDAYITTSDYDKPEFRIKSKKVEIYPGEKLVARGNRLMMGEVPTLYMPRYTQRLDGKEPWIHFTPGYDNDWGTFLLTDVRWQLKENLKGVVHLDYRELRDFAWGFDVDYKTPNMGDGLLKTYYMNERTIDAERIWEDRLTPTVEVERYKLEWRHKWDIDDRTSAVAQYYLLSDSFILKEYFEDEFDEDSNPDTFFLFTKNLTKGTLSLRSDHRINRFESKLERLPEIRYSLANEEIGNTGIYIKNTTTFSNLEFETAAPSEVDFKTKRLDTFNEVSYPFKVGFIEVKPFVGGRNTYYTRTKRDENESVVRGIFRTGATLSTKFYRIFDVNTDKFGADINRLRHIITPTISYEFQDEPTVANTDLDQFDTIDSQTNIHQVNFSIENKLQTKRNGTSVDLLRAVISAPYNLKEHPGRTGFSKINADIDVKPTDWLTLYFDSVYDTRRDHLDSANFDLFINGSDKWKFSLGKRYDREVDDQITAKFYWKINPKWAFRIYDRFDVDQGVQKELDIILTRDLHSWILDLHFNHQRNEGDEILAVFTLKAFPEIGFDFGGSFNEDRRPGSQ